MKDRGPYARIYYTLPKEYPEVYGSDPLLATYLRLLMDADLVYPIPVRMPLRSRYVRRLMQLGLVIELPGKLYTILGLEAERERRSSPGRIASAIRWQKRSNSDPPSIAMLERDRAEKSREVIESEREHGPQTFMGFKPKDPEGGAGLWHGKGAHDGRHHGCLVCAPLHPADCAKCQ